MLNKQLYIDQEAVATLGLLRDGLLYPANKLMDEEEAKTVDMTKKYRNTTFPFSLILAPSGKRNETILKKLKMNETIDLVLNGNICGWLKVDDVFKIDKNKRVQTIFGTQNKEHQGVNDTYKRLGNYAICGDFNINFDDSLKYKKLIDDAKKKTNAKKISSIIVSATPFHRVHERLIRTALGKCDLLILFVRKPYKSANFSFEGRKKTVEYFCDNYLVRDKVVVVPLDNTYIFGGLNELILNAIVVKNFGCDTLVIGQNHEGLGAYYNSQGFTSIVDTMSDIGINVNILNKLVYCNQCNTLINIQTCPHGSHHHINYHSQSILNLLELGIIPPAIFMRKEISSIILSDLFPNRLNKLNEIHQHLFAKGSLLDDFNSKNFYEDLMDLYQTSSLT